MAAACTVAEHTTARPLGLGHADHSRDPVPPYSSSAPSSGTSHHGLLIHRLRRGKPPRRATAKLRTRVPVSSVTAMAGRRCARLCACTGVHPRPDRRARLQLHCVVRAQVPSAITSLASYMVRRDMNLVTKVTKLALRRQAGGS